MRRPFMCCLLLAMFLLPAMGCSRSNIGEDHMTVVAEDDAEMNAAIATARSKLPQFWEQFENSGETEKAFGLKVEIKDANGTELFWTSDLEKKNGQIFGTITNEPEIVESVKNGERIEIPEDKIADWMYIRDGKMVGNYTLRVILSREPEEKAAPYRAILADP